MEEDRIVELVTSLKAQVSQLREQVGKIEEAMEVYQTEISGNGNNMGIRTRVAIIWRTYVWILCSASAVSGSFITWMVMRHLQN